MGIFNEHSHNNPFARGLQGAPGVGFHLTSDGDYDMVGKKRRNVGAPKFNSDAATKKYVDDNNSSFPTVLSTNLVVDSNIDMKSTYRILNLKTPIDADEPATKQYSDSSNFLNKDGSHAMTGDLNMGNNNIKNVMKPTEDSDAATKLYVDESKVDGSVFLKLDGTRKMTGNLDMNNKRIYNLPAPNNVGQPTPLGFTDFKYLHVAGTNKMTNNLNMDNKKIINLRPPTSNTDATTKKYVDDSIPDTSSFIKKDGSVSMTNNLNLGNKKIVGLATPTSNTDAATKKYVDDNTGAPDLSDYLEKDGTVAMTGNLDVGNNKKINLSKPTQDNDAVNKDYADKLVHHTAVQPSHYNNQFAYLMSSSDQWTDEIDGGNSFNITKIDNLPPSKGNFHDYNHKVLYTTIYKNSQGGYKYKMGINFYRLTANTEYTLCLEILNTDYQLWHKSQISVNKETSTGLSIGNVSVRKLSHRYSDPKGQSQFMYYHRIIVNFRKLSSGNKFFLHILVNIPQNGTDLAVYPRQLSGVYIIAYGIIGTTSNINPDKTYDYHTAFDIHPTEVKYNVDINANQKAIRNIKLERQSNNSAATVAMVKELIPYTTNILYRQYFEEYYDFSDANIYGINLGSSGVIINSLKPNITFPNKDLSNIREDDLNVNGYNITFSPSHSSKSTLCIVFYHLRNKNFSITKYLSTNNNVMIYLYYLRINNTLNLVINTTRVNFAMPSSFNGKKLFYG